MSKLFQRKKLVDDLPHLSHYTIIPIIVATLRGLRKIWQLLHLLVSTRVVGYVSARAVLAGVVATFSVASRYVVARNGRVVVTVRVVHRSKRGCGATSRGEREGSESPMWQKKNNLKSILFKNLFGVCRKLEKHFW